MEPHSPADDDALQQVLGEPPTAVRLLRENRYCRIFRAETAAGPAIVKRYIEGATHLEEREAAAIRRYETLAGEMPELIPMRLVGFEPQARTVAMSFSEGELMSRVLRRAPSDSAARRHCIEAMQTLGRVLAAWRVETLREDETPDPFLHEYLQYATEGLRRFPVFGARLASGPDADALFDALARDGGAPSFSHGDLSFANVLINGARVGIIDFANTSDRAHLLNDLYALKIALDAKSLPAALRVELASALDRGVGPSAEAPSAAHTFYRELHRRRWLFLHLVEGGPAAIARVVSAWPRLRRWSSARP